jgi:hypothetical protein
MRILYMMVGLALLIPADAFNGAVEVNLVAIVVALALIVFDWRRGRAGQGKTVVA